MAKIKTAWFCTNCGVESSKWMGRCSSCGEWNTLKEEVVLNSKRDIISKSIQKGVSPKPIPLENIEFNQENRISLNSLELNRVLGGGIVPGSLILIGGEPGIGKSTLSLQIPLIMSGIKTLYVSGEESPQQIKLRAQRIGGDQKNCSILAETILENILTHADEFSPSLIIIDSIQTIYTQSLEGSPGNVTQIRECAAAFLKYAKERNIPVILIGHITKEGSIAGPKLLEHIVDVVLQFEGDTRHSYRILRGIKNRFGSTAELAIFEMISSGLREVVNPSEMLIPMHSNNLTGIAVAAMLDGTRPFLIETQALVSSAAYGTPQRSATGFDVRRMNMLLAVLEKRAGFRLSVKDVFLNMAGGLKVTDPACDLAVVSAILSSNFDICLSQESVFCAEVGLSGEIRPVAQIEKRVAEAAKLGFEKIYISAYNKISKEHRKKIEIIELNDIPSLIKNTFNQ